MEKEEAMKRAKKPTPRPRKYLVVHLSIFRVAVVVTWETDKAWIMNHARRHNIAATEEGIGKELSRHIEKDGCLGLCVYFGDGNADVLVWLRERPERASQYGVLYHELHHAARRVSKDRNLKGAEAEAFIFEYLANECNSFLWPKK